MELAQASLRRAVEADATAFRALRLEALADSPGAFCQRYDEALTRSDERWAAEVKRSCQPGQLLAIAESAPGQWLAMIGAFRSEHAHHDDLPLPDPPVAADAQWAMLWGVYVTPAWRGRGLAEALLADALDWAHASGISWLGLQVSEANPRAIAFYRKVGFRPTSQRVPYPLDPTISEVTMLRRLR